MQLVSSVSFSLFNFHFSYSDLYAVTILHVTETTVMSMFITFCHIYSWQTAEKITHEEPISTESFHENVLLFFQTLCVIRHLSRRYNGYEAYHDVTGSKVLIIYCYYEEHINMIHILVFNIKILHMILLWLQTCYSFDKSENMALCHIDMWA